MPAKTKKKAKQMDDTNPQPDANENPQPDANEIEPTDEGVDSSDDEGDGIEDRLAAMEQLLVEIKDLLTGDKQVEREREAHVARHAKVPYVAPEMPAGLSPNQILAATQVNNPGLRAEVDAQNNNELDTEEEEESSRV
jgi:hypothetical protein